MVLFDGPRSAEPPRNQGMFCARTLSTLPEASRPAMPFGSAGKTGRLRSQPSGKFAPLHLVDLGGEFGVLGSISSEKLRPLLPGLRPARADAGGEVLIHTVGHEELRVFRPSVAAFGEADLLLAERLAVSRSGVLLVRGPVTDVAIEDDKGGAALGLPEDLESVLDAVDVVGVANPQDIPAITQEPSRNILREGDAACFPRW